VELVVQLQASFRSPHSSTDLTPHLHNVAERQYLSSARSIAYGTGSDATWGPI
jgi:hypothetical protein